jgi:hypothetical protein
VPPAEDSAYAGGRARALYAAYQDRLRALNAVRFRRPAAARGDDLPAHHPDVLAEYQRWFRYILVDEYQDTNVAQYYLAAAARAGAPQHLLRGRRRPVDLRLARRRGRQHPALREGFPGARSSGWNRTTARRRISSPPPRA